MLSFDPQPKAQAFSESDSHSKPASSAAGQTIKDLIHAREKYLSVFSAPLW